MLSEPVVYLKDIGVSLKGRQVLSNVTLSIYEGSFTGIIGPNGAGKTTLLRLILGLLIPDKGEIQVFGQKPYAFKKDKYKIGYLPQRLYFDCHFPVSVQDIVMMGRIKKRGLLRFIQEEDKEAAKKAMALVGIDELIDRPIGELSGGQQQLTFLARALSSQPRLLILDEPTNGLDLPAQERFYQLLKKLQSQIGLTIISASHDLAAISLHADELACINKTLHFHGKPLEVMDSDQLSKVYRCEFEVFTSRRYI